jgi:hypothetical protein
MRVPEPRRYNSTPLSQSALNPGTRLGPYEMTALLGVGGHGRGLPSDRSTATDAGPLAFIVNWQALIKK